MFDFLRSNAASQIPHRRGVSHLAGQALTAKRVQKQVKERFDGHQSK
jgi:hypothetical protein